MAINRKTASDARLNAKIRRKFLDHLAATANVSASARGRRGLRAARSMPSGGGRRPFGAIGRWRWQRAMPGLKPICSPRLCKSQAHARPMPR